MRPSAGVPCSQIAGWGTVHPGIGACKFHGGSTPSGRKAAQRVMVEKAVRTFALPVETTAEQALLDEIARAAGWVLWLEGQIEEYAGDDAQRLIQGTRSVRRKRDAEGSEEIVTEVGPGVHLWVELLHRERKMLRDASIAAIAAHLDERRVHAAEEQGERDGRLIQAIIRALDLAPDAQVVAFNAVRKLRLAG
jgi:hypothetical protein